MVCDVVRVRLHLCRMRVCGVRVDAPGRLEVAVESTGPSAPAAPSPCTTRRSGPLYADLRPRSRGPVPQ